MIEIRIDLLDQEDSEELVLMLRTLVDTFDEYFFHRVVKSALDRERGGSV